MAKQSNNKNNPKAAGGKASQNKQSAPELSNKQKRKEQKEKEAAARARTQAKKYAAQNRNKQDKVLSLAYWKGVRTELSKVIWPTRQELGLYTVVVIVTCAAFALGFWALDSGFLAILKAVLGITLG